MLGSFLHNKDNEGNPLGAHLLYGRNGDKLSVGDKQIFCVLISWDYRIHDSVLDPRICE